VSNVKDSLEAQIQTKLGDFHRTFFTRGRDNRFEHLVDEGAVGWPRLLTALGAADKETRVDALVTIGRMFETHGTDDAALRHVVTHAKGIRDEGLGPERQAACFALGRSRDPSLMTSFLPLLAAASPSAVNLAAFVLGYARWGNALTPLIAVVEKNRRSTVAAAIWALGQLGDARALAALLPMLHRGENDAWIVGALGDIGSPAALDAIAPLLVSQVTNTRFLAVAAISAIVDHTKERSARREMAWLAPTLRAAAKDPFPPVAVFAMLILAELGQRIDEADLKRALELAAPDTPFSNAEVFYLGKRS
jgi:hypothetical protein